MPCISNNWYVSHRWWDRKHYCILLLCEVRAGHLGRIMQPNFGRYMLSCQKPEAILKFVMTTVRRPATLPSSLIMTGLCTVFWAAGRHSLQCPCLHGVFDASPSQLNPDPECTECSHPFSRHEVVTPAPAKTLPGKFSLSKSCFQCRLICSNPYVSWSWRTLYPQSTA